MDAPNTESGHVFVGAAGLEDFMKLAETEIGGGQFNRETGKFERLDDHPNNDEWVIETADDLDEGQIEPRAWLTPQLCRRNVSVLVAPGGAGKTTLAIALAMSLATGRPLIGEKVHHRARVLLVTAEDGRDELRRRLRAARMHHEIGKLDDWLRMVVLTGRDAAIATMDQGRAIETGNAARIEKIIRDRRIDAVILDPMIKLAGVPENDNTAVDFVMRLLVGIADSCNVAIMLLHHVRKGSLEPGSADAARGAKSLIDAARLAFTIAPMSPEEAKTFGILEAERRRLIRLDNAKANILPPAATARWFRLASVSLGNATPEYPDGDSVQALDTWIPPDAWDGLTNEKLNCILDDIDAGTEGGERYSDNNAAKSRAVWRVVQQHSPEKTEGQCREIIKTWLKTGLLTVVEYTSPRRHEPAKGLAVDVSRRPS